MTIARHGGAHRAAPNTTTPPLIDRRTLPRRRHGRHRRAPEFRSRWGRLLPLLGAGLLVPTLAWTQPEVPERRFSWPLTPQPPVVRQFEAPADPYGPGHRGVDLGAAPGQPILAAGEGVVVFAGPLAGRGVVSVDHEGGLRTTYEPLAAAVRAGDRLHRGQSLGTVEAGHQECTTAACLHWGVRRGEQYLDPLPLVRADTVLRLKPWDG